MEWTSEHILVTEAELPLSGVEADELQRLREGVLALLHLRVNDRALAEDLCSETFRIVLERLREEPLRDADKLPAYLSLTARNLALNAIRDRKRQKTDTGRQDAIERVTDPAADPAEAMEAALLARMVRQLLEEIPNLRDREILVRTYLRDQDQEDICRDLGIDKDHYRRVVSRARARLRTLLEDRYRIADLRSFALA